MRIVSPSLTMTLCRQPTSNRTRSTDLPPATCYGGIRPVEFLTILGHGNGDQHQAQIAMKTRASNRDVGLLMLGIMLLMAAGCRSSHSEARSNPELEEAKVVKER